MTDIPLAKKSLGQHWLYDAASLEAMANEAGVVAGDTVLEVGPGTGSLTGVLLDRGASVIAVELDRTLTGQLRQAFKGRDITVYEQSILEFDLTAVPADYKLVANIPYYLTSNLIRVLSESTNPPQVAVLLIQKEVAQRLAAEPGSMSLLSVSAQYYWQVRTGREVPAALFIPPPKVDSQIAVLERRAEPLFADMPPKVFFRTVKAGFSSRRKTLSNSLAGGLRLKKADLEPLFNEAQVDPRTRPQQLDLEAWHRLAVAVEKRFLRHS